MLEGLSTSKLSSFIVLTSTWHHCLSILINAGCCFGCGFDSSRNCFLDKADVNNASLGDLLAHVTPVSWLLWKWHLTHANASGAQSSNVEVDSFEIPLSAKILALSVVCCTWQMDEMFVLLALLSCLCLAKGGTTANLSNPEVICINFAPVALFSWMCTSRWDWAREGWEDENDWGYQIEMDTEPSNDSCWKANWWQGRMNACICCMLVGFWNLPLVLSFENLWEAKERDGTQLAVNIKKKLIEQVQSGKCQTDKCQAVGPKNVYKRIFHKNTNPQKTIAEPVIPKSKIPRKLPNPPVFRDDKCHN